MHLGIAVPTYLQHGQAKSILKVALKAEELGYDSLWVPDHLVTGGAFLKRMGPTWYEPFVTLAYLAAKIPLMQLGFAVVVVPYRHPIVLAKLVATLDRLSGGRVILGVGTGHMEIEFNSAGITFESRGPVTDEYLQILKLLWSDKPTEFHGEFCDISMAAIEPKPLQKPHPPIWIGGNSRAAMRRAAHFGDGWHPLRLTPEELTDNITQMESLRISYRRENPITISLQTEYIKFAKQPLASDRKVLQGSAEQITEDMLQYQKAGLDSAALRFGMARTLSEQIEWMEEFATEVRPHLPR